MLKKGSSAVANSRVGKAFVNGCKKVAGVSYHQPDNVALYPKLKKDLTLRQFTNVTKTTQHGIERLIERGFSPIDIIELKTAPDIIMTQQDGAKVFIKSYNGKFNIIVEGDNGIITSLKGLSKDALDKLEKNYNWRKNG